MRGCRLLPSVKFKNKGQDRHDQGGHGRHPKRQGEGWQWNGGSAQHLCAQSPRAGSHQGQHHAHGFARQVGQLVPQQEDNPKRCGKHPAPCALRQLVVEDQGTDQG